MNTFLAALLLASVAPIGVAVEDTPETNVQGAPAGLRVGFEAPSLYVSGRAFLVQVEIQAPEQGAPVAAWLLSPSAFTVNGEPLARRGEDVFVPLPPNARLELSFDLGPFLDVQGNFELGFAPGLGADQTVAVRTLTAVAEGEDGPNFMEIEADQLDSFYVLMETVRGEMLFEFWPDVAPGHVRNFLDLCHTGFYEGLLFHRVIPGFMIQGGCPNTRDANRRHVWGTGGGPRASLEAEFNRRPDRRHRAGVLSMARSTAPNSASSQFFVMHADYPSLDGQYSTFGRLVSGSEVVDRIVNTPRDQMDRPNEEQRILRTTVVTGRR